MTTELKKQKLQEYIENAAPEDIDIMYDDYLDETGPTDWSDEFTAEMEERVREIESGEVKTIPMEEVFAELKNATRKMKDHAVVPS